MDSPTGELLPVSQSAVFRYYNTNMGQGTIAATIHSIVGDVQAGTIFAILQSAAAGGIGIAVVQSIVQALIAALFTISGILGIGTLEDLIRQIGDATGEFMASFFSSGGEDDVPLLGASEHVKQE